MKSKKEILLKLFISTLYLSTFTFGGGYVIVTLMKKKFVDEYHWIDEKEMLDLIAIAQSSPGAIAVNGFKSLGPESWSGPLVAAVGERHGFTMDTPLEDFSPEAKKALLYGTGDEVYDIRRSFSGPPRPQRVLYKGIIPTIEERMEQNGSDAEYYEQFLEESDCPECGGRGRVFTVQHTFLGDMQTASTCRNCGGTGKVIDHPCEECEGQGRIPDRQHVTVEVPAGIREGQQLRVSGFGEAGMHGAKAGDLIVTCRIQPHEFFEREGDNLHARANISFIQATLGAEIEIDGIFEDEKVQVRIPEGCQNEQVVRVKGMGMPRLNADSRGDMYVHINVLIPKRVTKKQRELLEKVAQEFGEEVAAPRSPLQKLRDAFN